MIFFAGGFFVVIYDKKLKKVAKFLLNEKGDSMIKFFLINLKEDQKKYEKQKVTGCFAGGSGSI